jgi:hypothetical protein
MSNRHARAQRRAQQRDEQRRQQAKAAPTEWAQLTKRQKHHAAKRPSDHRPRGTA